MRCEKALKLKASCTAADELRAGRSALPSSMLPWRLPARRSCKAVRRGVRCSDVKGAGNRAVLAL